MNQVYITYENSEICVKLFKVTNPFLKEVWRPTAALKYNNVCMNGRGDKNKRNFYYYAIATAFLWGL